MESRMQFEIKYVNGGLILENSNLESEEKAFVEKYLKNKEQSKIIGVYENSPVYSLFLPPLTTNVGTRYIKIKIQNKFYKKNIPNSLTISLTKFCQCDCEDCHLFQLNKSSEKIMNLAGYREAIRQSIELGVTNVVLLGGEPLLKKGLYKLIESVDKTKANTIVFSNGEYLTYERCRKLKELNVYGVFVAFDSYLEEEHDSQQLRTGLFQKAVEAVENLKKVGIMVGVNTTLNKERIAGNYFDKFMDFCKVLGVQEVSFYDSIPSGRNLFSNPSILNREDRIALRDKINQYKKKLNYPIIGSQISSVRNICSSSFCYSSSAQFYITSNGEFCACDFTPLSIGKFPERSIQYLWNKLNSTFPINQRTFSCKMQDLKFRNDFLRQLTSDKKVQYPIPLNTN